MTTPPPLPPQFLSAPPPQATYTAPAYPPPLPAVPLGYATPPTAYVAPYAWRDGRTLMVPKGAILPPQCVKCNAPAEGEMIRRNFTWHTPALYLLILAGVLIYAVVAVFVQEKATVGLHLCARHRRRRIMMGVTAAALCVGGLAMCVFAAAMNEGWPAAAGGVMFLAGLIVALANQTLTAKRIDAHYVWLGGVNEGFLATFPSTGR